MKLRLFWIGTILLLLLMFVALYMLQNNRGPKYFWGEDYKFSSTQPYGTKVLGELLESFFPENLQKGKNAFESEKWNKSQDGYPNYFYIGRVLNHSERAIDSLLSRVERGTDAMLIANEFPGYLMDSLFALYVPKEQWNGTHVFNDSMISAGFYHPKLRNLPEFHFDYRFAVNRVEYQWPCFNGNLFGDNSGLIALGYFNSGYVNFIKIKFGKGSIFLHSNPLIFSNYHLVRAQGASYVSTVLSHLGRKPAYLDIYSQNPATEGSGASQSPLQLIYSNPPLNWAWNIFLFLLLVYLIFTVRRNQRVIPVIEQPENSSLAFAATIGRLYFLQQRHDSMVKHQWRYFQSFIKQRYRIQAGDLDERTIESLSQRSGIQVEKIVEIRDAYQLFKSYVVIESQHAFDFYKLLGYFYKNCN